VGSSTKRTKVWGQHNGVGDKTELSERVESLRKQMAECLHVRNDMAKAEELCSEILSLSPLLSEFVLKRALVRESLGKNAEALQDAALYQHLYPFSLESLSVQARLLEKTGRKDAALKVLKLLLVFNKDQMLQDEYERIKAQAAKPRKKARKKPKTDAPKPSAKAPLHLSKKAQAMLDETGFVILEEEKIILLKDLRKPDPVTLEETSGPIGSCLRLPYRVV